MGGRSGTLALLALAALVAVPGIGGGASAGAGTGAAPGPTGPGCTGTHLAAEYRGALQVYQPYGALPSVADRTVAITFAYQLNYSEGGRTELSCESAESTAVTGRSGNFTLVPTLPSPPCTLHSCPHATGPFGPVKFSVTSAPPPGDLLRVGMDAGEVAFVWTAAVRSVALVPEDGAVVSADAPAAFTVEPRAGDGGASPATLAVHWVVSGKGWRLLDAGRSANTSVEGDAAAIDGRLTVFANASFEDTVYPMAAVSTALVDETTEIASASLSQGAADLGESVGIVLEGSGAAGYRYSAQVVPGLGVATTNLTCASDLPRFTHTVLLACRGAFSYNASGTVVPQVLLSNGYSAAIENLSALDVARGLALSDGAATVAGYAGRPTDFALSVDPGTGTGPFGPACLAPGTNTTVCATASAGPWSFAYTYPTPGRYAASLSVVDATGANVSLVVPAIIAAVPALTADGATDAAGTVGSPTALAANLSGGVLPIAYWWNSSRPSGTVRSGLVDTDGGLSVAFVPTEAGPTTVTLTVRDALGTRLAIAFTVAASDGPAVGLRVLGAPDLPATPAGGPVVVTIAAVDAYGGGTVFAGPATVVRSGPAGAAPLAVWAAGRFLAGPGATLAVPTGAWEDGALTLTLEANTSGLYGLAVATGEGWNVSVSLPVGPDLHRLVLSEPWTADAGARSASTRYRITDAYGNPVLSGYVVVRSQFGSDGLVVDAPVAPAGGTGYVWVNYSALSSAAGSVTVTDAYGDPLLPTIAVAAAPAPLDGALFAGGIGAVVAAAVGVGLGQRAEGRRRARPPSPALTRALARAAGGREHVLGRLARGPTDSIAYLALGWEGPPPRPSPAEAAEWVAALVADGTVTARPGPAGRPVFVRSEPPAAGRPAPHLDEGLLDRALARRDPPD